MSKLKWIKDELNDLKIINRNNNLTEKGKELILEYEYVLNLENNNSDVSTYTCSLKTNYAECEEMQPGGDCRFCDHLKLLK